MSAILPLEGLYLRLVKAGMPISVRDYQDALFALRSGDGLHSREELHWLCEALWARTDQEVALLDDLLGEEEELMREEFLEAVAEFLLPGIPAL